MGEIQMTSTNSTVRGLEARRASLAPGAYLAIVHVSPGERLGPIGHGAVLSEVLDHVAALESEHADERDRFDKLEAHRNAVRSDLEASVLACDTYRDEIESLRSSVTLAGAALGVTSDDQDEFVRLARLAAEDVVLYGVAVKRIIDALHLNEGTPKGAVNALDELAVGLARSRGAR